MNNLECVIAVLASHRDARRWSDEAVALDLLAQLGLDAEGDAKNAAPVFDPSLLTEDQVVAAETAAKEATDKATAQRDALNAQTEAQAKPADAAPADHAPADPALVNPNPANPDPAPLDPAPVNPAPLEGETTLTPRQQRAADKAEAEKANQA